MTTISFNHYFVSITMIDFSTGFKILHAIIIDKNIPFSYQLMYNFIGLL
jgi:hypothetical protein